MAIKRQKSELYLKKEMVFSNPQKNDQLTIQNVVQMDEHNQSHKKQKSKLDSIIRPLEIKQKQSQMFSNAGGHKSRMRLFLYDQTDTAELGIEKSNEYIQL